MPPDPPLSPARLPIKEVHTDHKFAINKVTREPLGYVKPWHILVVNIYALCIYVVDEYA